MGKPDDYAGLSILRISGGYIRRALHSLRSRALPSARRLSRVETREWTPEGVASVEIEQTTFARKTEITCLRSSRNFREVHLVC